MMKEFEANSYLFGGNAPFVEELYEQYLINPKSVAPVWREYFDSLQQATSQIGRDIPRAPVEASFRELAKQPRLATQRSETPESTRKQISLLRMINAYRALGCRQATLDPLRRMDQTRIPELTPAFHGLSDADAAVVFGTNITSMEQASLAKVMAFLKQTYCGNIGLEFMHITHSEQRRWVQDWFEDRRSTPAFPKEKKLRILKQVTAAETLEQYLHKKYVGQKRFSLEGGDSLIAGLDSLIHASAAQGLQEIVIGMAHRGRLNVLVNLLGKQPRDLFSEFEGKTDTRLSAGDVKYHMGFSSDIATSHGSMHLSLAFNPSHLEIVNPVVEGSTRARQQRRGDHDGSDVMSVLIHGDAAFIGLGTNQGTFNLSQTRGYRTGGTLHLVVNNQIGFTTSDLRDARSSIYCTDIAKMIEAPIFHVNGDDPEALCLVLQAALEYRMKFRKDVVIDLVCFRRHGHNEADDPFVTQPMMYKKIAAHPGVRSRYAERLVAEGVVTEAGAKAMIDVYRAALDRGEHVELTALSGYRRKFSANFDRFIGADWRHSVETAVPQTDLIRLADKFTRNPEGFKLRNAVEKLLVDRSEMVRGNLPVDWGMAEHLAYATLLKEGYGVRLSGEDAGRGTFSHRHAVLHDQNREKWDQGAYVPLEHLSEKQAHFIVIDSILNEEAVLAYEYGYATSAPDELVIWEAQFGDFANGAQVVIDQFIAAGEAKWGRLCGLVMLLPHGYDGQGPEHSSARVERYLQLCAEHNIQVVMMSEAAQMFHVLRRQILRPVRKPLVVIMSKRLLRYKDSMSPIGDFASGGFRLVIGDPAKPDPAGVKRVILCAGQVYYDLANARKERGNDEIAIVRLEQLYPFPTPELQAELAQYAGAQEVMWVQEEPHNQGAWFQIRHRLEECLLPGQTLRYAGRPDSASPAVGSMAKHNAQLKAFLDEAMSVDLDK
ncbi:2-oxoglutarate dehydrogenase E1 component [Formivibrio citricus]|uniref:2-oxoglutarate dehydrogenase E1 component n=1 Tax=Formivibrio citricus TaxID=83765 RepID=A0A1I4V207_9NEIS|nr:2-oxoglutarate dehydrogenase E1 component [Formivibrio citricus]SFM95226.1 2-oxoglutarate dehydrogenase E1 component [Formivibrio citricus]